MSFQEIPPKSGNDPQEGSSGFPDDGGENAAIERAAIEEIIKKKMAGEPLSASEQARYGVKKIEKLVDKEVIRRSKKELPKGRQRGVVKPKAEKGLDSLARIEEINKEEKEKREYRAKIEEFDKNTSEEEVNNALEVLSTREDYKEEREDILAMMASKDKRAKVKFLVELGVGLKQDTPKEAEPIPVDEEGDKKKKVAEIVGGIKATLEKSATTSVGSVVRAENKKEKVIPPEDLREIQRMIAIRRAGAFPLEKDIPFLNKYEFEIDAGINALNENSELQKDVERAREDIKKGIIPLSLRNRSFIWSNQEEILKDDETKIAYISIALRDDGDLGLKRLARLIPDLDSFYKKKEKEILKKVKDFRSLSLEKQSKEGEKKRQLDDEALNFFREPTKRGILPKNEQNIKFFFDHFDEIMEDEDAKIAYFAIDRVKFGKEKEGRRADDQAFIDAHEKEIAAKAEEFSGKEASSNLKKEEEKGSDIETQQIIKPETKKISLGDQVKDFVHRMTSFEDMSSPEDLEFQANNGPAIEAELAIYQKKVEDLAWFIFNDGQMTKEQEDFYKANEQNVDTAISRHAKEERKFDKTIEKVGKASAAEQADFRSWSEIKDPSVAEAIEKMNLDLRYVYNLVPEFFILEPGKQLYILDKVRQKANLDATFEAEEIVKKDLAQKVKSPIGFFKKMYKAFTKEHQETKARRLVIQEKKERGMMDYAEDIGAMTKHVAQLEQNITYNEDGLPRIEYVDPASFVWDSEYVKRFKKDEHPSEYVDRFNDAATALSEMPHEWAIPGANPIDRIKYNKALRKYEMQRNILFGAVVEQKKKEIPDDEEKASQAAMAWLNNMDSKVKMNQLFTEYPQIENYEEKGFSWNPDDLNSKELRWYGRGFLMAAGMSARWWTRQTWAPVAGAAFAGGLGGLMALRKKWVEYDDKEKKKRYGETIEDKGIKKFLNASETAERLGYFIEKLESTDPGDKRDALVRRLKNHICVVEERIGAGRVNFGDKNESLVNKTKLIQALSEARTKLFILGEFNEDENTQKLFDRFNRYQKDSQAKWAKVKNLAVATGWGAAKAAAFFGAGYAIGEFSKLVGSPQSILQRINEHLQSQGDGTWDDVKPGLRPSVSYPNLDSGEAILTDTGSVQPEVPLPPTPQLDNVPTPPKPVLEPEPSSEDGGSVKVKVESIIPEDQMSVEEFESKKFNITRDASGRIVDISPKNLNDFESVKEYIKHPEKYFDFSRSELPWNLEKPQWGMQALTSAKAEVKEFLATQQLLEKLEKTDPNSPDIPAVKEHMIKMGGEVRTKVAEFFRRNASTVFPGNIFKPYEDIVAPAGSALSTFDDATASLEGGGVITPEIEDVEEVPVPPPPTPVSLDTSDGEKIFNPGIPPENGIIPPPENIETPTVESVPVSEPSTVSTTDSAPNVNVIKESNIFVPDYEQVSTSDTAAQITESVDTGLKATSDSNIFNPYETSSGVEGVSSNTSPEVTKTVFGTYSLEKTPTERIINVDNDFIKGKVTLLQGEDGVKEIYDKANVYKDLNPDDYFVDGWEKGLTPEAIADNEKFLRAYLINKDLIAGQVIEEGDEFYKAVNQRTDIAFDKIKDILQQGHKIVEEVSDVPTSTLNMPEDAISTEELNIANESGVEVGETAVESEVSSHGKVTGEYVSELRTSPTDRIISFNNPDGEIRGQIKLEYDEKTGEVLDIKYSKDIGSRFGVREESVWNQHMEDNWQNNLGTRSSLGVEMDTKEYIRHKGILKACGFEPETKEYEFINKKLEAIIRKSGKFIKEETIFPAKN